MISKALKRLLILRTSRKRLIGFWIRNDSESNKQEGVVIKRTLSVVMVSPKVDGYMYQDFTVIENKVGPHYSGFKLHGTEG